MFASPGKCKRCGVRTQWALVVRYVFSPCLLVAVTDTVSWDFIPVYLASYQWNSKYVRIKI